MSIEDIIAKLEAATGKSRDLDAAIADGHGVKVWHEGDWVMDWAGAITLVPDYTASVDAAVLLVPEDMDWLVRTVDCGGFANVTAIYAVPGVTIHKPMPDGTFRSVRLGSDDGCYPAYAASPALALCIAALKAQAAVRKEPV